LKWQNIDKKNSCNKWQISASFLFVNKHNLLSLRICQVYPLSKIVVLTAYLPESVRIGICPRQNSLVGLADGGGGPSNFNKYWHRLCNMRKVILKKKVTTQVQIRFKVRGSRFTVREQWRLNREPDNLSSYKEKRIILLLLLILSEIAELLQELS